MAQELDIEKGHITGDDNIKPGLRSKQTCIDTTQGASSWKEVYQNLGISEKEVAKLFTRGYD
jgi:hypothetical protein